MVEETFEEFFENASQEDLDTFFSNYTNSTDLTFTDYEVSSEYDFNPHSLVMGMSERYADFFDYTSHA